MSGVGRLSSTCLQPAPFLEEGEHGVEEQVFGSSLNQALAKLT
jgi:hypothetical protein